MQVPQGGAFLCTAQMKNKMHALNNQDFAFFKMEKC